MTPAKQRWVTIGTVKMDHYVNILNCGFPGGLEIHWRHRTDWCQPWQFLRWPDLMSAVDRRLNIAGLRRVAAACDAQRSCGRIVLRVQVVRFQNWFHQSRNESKRKTYLSLCRSPQSEGKTA